LPTDTLSIYKFSARDLASQDLAVLVERQLYLDPLEAQAVAHQGFASEIHGAAAFVFILLGQVVASIDPPFDLLSAAIADHGEVVEGVFGGRGRQVARQAFEKAHRGILHKWGQMVVSTPIIACAREIRVEAQETSWKTNNMALLDSQPAGENISAAVVGHIEHPGRDGEITRVGYAGKVQCSVLR
jgi:hypothetical protein